MLEAIRRFFEARGMLPAQMERQIELWRRGHEPPNLEAALRVGRAWQEEQAQPPPRQP